ncbi:MAG TPA: GAF domain-containing protein [Planctomycetota bacterium]|nr:GAF domain-containing protein [Planctomycetota bacterium]
MAPPLDRAACQQGRLSRLLRRLLAEAVAACRATECTLWVPSADRTAIEGALNHGHTPDILESVAVPVGDSVVGLVFRTGAAACIGPGDPHNPSVDERTGLPTQAMAAAPVRIGSETVAVLSAINPTHAQVFSRADLEALEWKAYLAALVIEDARDE